ncbi:TolC family outer membrane protein [Haematobacter massiliensis]|uniref:TolC family outer membrane protein n=1 Tax=Haematobacter massiliensis TaxID=195105 RepID=UPI0023F03C63|nr:TolC family outer membrane protein [Haematobacter massiliensis]
MAGRSKVRFFAALVAAGLSVTSVRAETLTDALIAAYRNSNLLEQNRAVLRAADEDVATAVAALRPTLAFVAQSRWVDPVLTRRLTSSIGLSANLTLYDSGRNRLGIEIARESVLATREALVGVEQQVLLNAVQAYMNVRSAIEYVSLNQNSVRVIGEELRAAQDRFDVGEVTRTDVAQAEARLASARAQLSSAQGDLTTAREAYKAATGQYPGSLATPPTPPRSAATVDDAKAVGVRTHPDVRQAQRQVNVAELNVSLTAAQRLPTVSATGSVARDQSGDDASSLTLSLSQPIYQGGALSSLHRQAIAGRDQARAALQQSAVNVAYQVGAAWSDLQVSRASLASIDEQIRAAQVAYDGVREEARFGARTTLDVLDAEQELLNARASRISAQSQQYVAAYSVLSAMGLLTVDHLKLGIPTYDPAAYYNAVREAPYTSIQGQKLDRVLQSIGKK